jgi:hypothetical protein
MAADFDPWPGASRLETSGGLPETLEHAGQLLSLGLEPGP